MENHVTIEELAQKIEALEAEVRALRQDARDGDQTLAGLIRDSKRAAANPRLSITPRVVQHTESGWSQGLIGG